MSLLEDLAQQGISAEDLEKAASVRLFEKVAANEGIDFNKLNDEQIDELYNHFVTEVLPGLDEGEAPAGAASTEAQATVVNDAEKAASILLFQKQAAAEEIDLESLNEEQIQGLYGHFLENVLPNMIEQESPEAKQAAAAEVEEAQAKLAEVEILGRHMARSFNDELDKIAEDGGDDKPGMSKKKKALMAAGGVAGAGLLAAGAKKGYDALKAGGKAAAPKLLTAAGKTASADNALFDKLAEERAGEILQANGIDPAAGGDAEQGPEFDELVTARAVEMLQQAGYTFEE